MAVATDCQGKPLKQAPDWESISEAKRAVEARYSPKKRLTKKAEPSTQARKAARRRAKAGRKASR
ncbi:hypothetical protein [Hymenobacter metallicola]|uniref:Uncharacterized protein n=1 Tax=Hymenobacter metallicola TaxID=2563114 RepID=A0A4Z0PZR9_9BACT|nr:hypothetical protein [Hymenobacter metallicola]TGE22814.1 hypothetical protein E5K02_20835 [Hymenobacter metallicola]